MPNLKGIVDTVRIIVADDAGNILATSDRGGDVSVISFTYTFDDEDPDECQIKLQTKDPVAFDSISIGRSSRLQVSWGYIGGPMVASTIVVVRDLESKYGAETINTTLVCSDLLFYLNTTRAQEADMVSTIDHIKNQFFGRYKVIIKDSGKPIWVLDFYKEEKRIEYTHYDVIPTDPFDVYPFELEETTDPISLVDPVPLRSPVYGPSRLNSLDVKVSGMRDGWYVGPENEIRAWLEKSRGVLEGNRSQMTVIRDLLKECPKGPWYVTGRGQTLLIHNRDFINAPIRVYSYQKEPGHLIDFTAKTKYDQFEKNSVSHEMYDPEHKIFYEQGAYLDELFSMVSFKEKFEDRSLTEKEFKAWLEEWVNLLQAYEKWQTTRVGISIYGDSLELDKTVYIKESAPSPYLTSVQHRKLLRTSEEPHLPPDILNDNTAVKYPSPYFHEVVYRGFIYSRPLEFIEDRGNFIANQKREMEMEKEEAKIIVVGDPFLQSQLRVQIANVHYQHKGLYYIKKCEHEITHQGYKTTLSCVKVLSTNRLRVGDSQESIKIVDGEEKPKVEIEKQFAKEEELFGKPIRIEVVEDPQITTNVTGPGYGVSMDFGQSKPGSRKVHTIQEEMAKENFIQTITELKFGGKARIAPNVEDN